MTEQKKTEKISKYVVVHKRMVGNPSDGKNYKPGELMKAKESDVFDILKKGFIKKV